MRIPDHPPKIEDIVARHGPEIFREAAKPDFARLVREWDDRYLHWQRLKFVAAAEGIEAERAWAAVKLARMSRYRTLPLEGDRGCNLVFLHTDRMLMNLMRIDQELAGQITSDLDQPVDSWQKERFIVNALREEAIASSMLEGASTTRAEAKKMLRTGRAPRTRGEQMVFNNYRAIEFIRENRHTELSTELLLELQTILTVDTLDDPGESGRFRDESDPVQVEDSRTGEVVHIPPPANELRNRLARLCDFANRPVESLEFVHPVVKACILHFQIGFDHPFCDGNGRTARALFYWHMLRSGYWLFEYLPISRLIYRSPAQYTRAYLYTETDDFDVTYFLHYHMRVIEMARSDLREYLSRKHREMVEARKLVSDDPSLNHRQQELLLRAARNPDQYFTIDQHQGRHNVVYETARRDLLGLEAAGYLRKTKVGKAYIFRLGDRLRP